MEGHNFWDCLAPKPVTTNVGKKKAAGAKEDKEKGEEKPKKSKKVATLAINGSDSDIPGLLVPADSSSASDLDMWK